MTKPIILNFACDESGCGILRGYIPNQILSAEYGVTGQYSGIMVSPTAGFISDVNLLARTKVIKFQKIVTDPQLKYVQALTKARQDRPDLFTYKFVYDQDDVMTDMPDYNFGAREFYNKDTAWRECYPQILKMMDMITVSTDFLKEHVKEIVGDSVPIVVLPNYLPKSIYNKFIDRNEPIIYNHKKPRVCWSGSPSHFYGVNDADLSLIRDLVIMTIDKFDWVFIGALPPFINMNKKLKSKVKFIPWMKNLYSYPEMFVKEEIDFGLAPLLQNTFNQAKSNLKYLEYCAFQSVAICTDIDNYQDCQLKLTNNWKEMGKMILNLFDDKETRKDILKRQNQFIEKNWFENNLDKYKEIYQID